MIRRYQTPITQYCWRMTGSRQDAEELAQDAFVRVHRHLHRLKPRAKFSTFLFGVARNLTLNRLRDAKRRGRDVTRPLDGCALPGDETRRPDRGARVNEIRAVIERGLGMLTPEHREILVLRELNGMDYETIARVMKCRKGTVKSRLARAREQLRLRILELGGDLL